MYLVAPLAQNGTEKKCRRLTCTRVSMSFARLRHGPVGPPAPIPGEPPVPPPPALPLPPAPPVPFVALVLKPVDVVVEAFELPEPEVGGLSPLNNILLSSMHTQQQGENWPNAPKP